MTTQAIWQQFRDDIDAFIRRRVSNPADAEDLRQQVYLQIHRHLQTKQAPAHLRGWVYQVARNAIIDHHRRRAVRRREGNGEAVGATAVAEPTLDTSSEEPAAVEAAEAVEGLGRCLLGIVDRLPEPYQSAVRWTELEGLTQQAAAGRAGTSVSGMKSRVQRGRSKLRDALLACCEVELDARNQPMTHRCRTPACGCSTPKADA